MLTCQWNSIILKKLVQLWLKNILWFVRRFLSFLLKSTKLQYQQKRMKYDELNNLVATLIFLANLFLHIEVELVIANLIWSSAKKYHYFGKTKVARYCSYFLVSGLEDAKKLNRQNFHKKNDSDRVANLVLYP